MALIKLKSNLSSKGKTVDYFDNENQTGFTSGREQGDSTEFNRPVNSLFSTKGKVVDYFDNKNQTGFTPNRQPGDSTEFKQPAKSLFNDNIGGTNTTETGTFSVNQRDNTERKTQFTDNQVNAQHKKFKPDDDQLITHDIGDKYKGTSKDGGFVRGGFVLNTDRQIEDAKRLTKFLATPKGFLFKEKQSVLQKKNARPETREYDRTSIIRNIDSVTEVLNGDVSEAGQNRHTGNNYENNPQTFQGKVNSAAVSYFSTTQNVGVSGSKKLQVLYGGEFGSINKVPGSTINDKKETTLDTKGSDDFIKFKIRDAVNGKWIIFPALITGITDNSQASYNKIQYIGRPDSVHVYQNFNRNISFSLKVLATNENELGIVWQKVSALKGLTQPSFKPFFYENNDSRVGEKFTRPTAPYVYLTIGDMFKNTPGYFESVNVTIPEASSWEIIDGAQFPHMCDISCTFQYIGRELPSTRSLNYDGLKEGIRGQNKLIKDKIPTAEFV